MYVAFWRRKDTEKLHRPRLAQAVAVVAGRSPHAAAAAVPLCPVGTRPSRAKRCVFIAVAASARAQIWLVFRHGQLQRPRQGLQPRWPLACASCHGATPKFQGIDSSNAATGVARALARGCA